MDENKICIMKLLDNLRFEFYYQKELRIVLFIITAFKNIPKVMVTKTLKCSFELY